MPHIEHAGPPIATHTEGLLRASLVVVWLGTAAVSLLEWDGQSRALLAAAGVVDPAWTHLLTGAGAGADLLVGLLLWWRPGRLSLALALGLMGVMTVVATALAPTLWLHPLGPLLKNLPIAALLWHLLHSPRSQPCTPTC